MTRIDQQEKIDVILSIAPHEILSTDNPHLHPFFSNLYFTCKKDTLAVYLPFKNFCYIVSAPSALFIPAFGESTSAKKSWDELETEAHDINITSKYPWAIMSKIKVDIINAEETAEYGELLNCSFIENLMWHIDSNSITAFLFVPCSSIVIRLIIGCQFEVHNAIDIEAIRSMNKLIKTNDSKPTRNQAFQFIMPTKEPSSAFHFNS